MLDLQLFAEDIEIEEELEEVETQEEEVEEETTPSLMDILEENDEVKAQFQSEVDRMITRALQTREKKHQEELKKEKQRANMTAEELQAEKERELSEREEQLRQYELKLAKVEYFKENNLPLDLIDFVNVSEEEEIGEKATVLSELINAEVEKQLKVRMKETGITIEDKEPQGQMTIEDLSDLSVDEINAVWDKINK